MSDDVPANAPESCPGARSEAAGQAGSCQGCPNQSICRSGAGDTLLKEQEAADVELIRQRMSRIRHKVLILSGKGGVGKSSLTACLAYALAEDPGRQIAVLDVDLCGPSMAAIFGVVEGQGHVSGYGLSPVYVTDNLAVMSVACLVDAGDALLARGPIKNTMIKKFLHEVAWIEEGEPGMVDFLLVDTPPGTSDEHLSIVNYLKKAGALDTAIIVTTPQEVALADVRKEVNFCRKVGLPILGVVENMSVFVCPQCATPTPIFPPTTGGAKRMCEEMGLQMLASLPFDPRLTRLLDRGVSPFEMNEEDDQADGDSSAVLPLLPPDAPILTSLRDLTREVVRRLQVGKEGAVCQDRETGELHPG